MRGAFNKDVLRSVTHSLGRFLAIAGIVALGTGFYAGLRMTAPDMKLAADQFYDGTNLMDIRVVSTLGLTDGDLAALRGVEGVAQVMGAYETDVMATVNDEQYAIRVHSLPAAAAESDTGDGVNAVSDAVDYLNRPVLVEGSWPVREGECVLSADKVMNTPTKIGDTVQITEGSQDVDDVLATRTYQVVGYVHSSYYVSSTSMGTTSLGSGSVQQFMFVPESDFSKDLPYTEAFVTVAGAADEFSGSDAYFERVHEVEDRIEALAPAREQARVDGLRADAQKELDEKRADYERERADAEQQLDDAQRQLDEAAAAMQAQIAQAKAEQDSVGGVIECVVEGLPAGIGDPMFGGLENRIARTVFAIPAVKGVEFGAGFAAARLRGSENNDPFCVENGKIVTKTNHCGGILGGISNGMPVVFRAAFKPTPSISREQDSVSLSRMEETKLVIHGRHDPCIVPRAVPCVEAAAAIAVLDAGMERKKELGYGY